MEKFQKEHPLFYLVTSEQQDGTDLCLEPLLPTKDNIPTCVCSSGVVKHEMNPRSSKRRRIRKKKRECKMTK
jgi:hypothetical protein